MISFELAKHVQPRRHCLPILLTTACMTLFKGASLDRPHFSKPYRQKELCQKIAQAMRPAG
ncbi:MAG: hypothetical protein H7345_05785 [Rubritepida sp.]|nr:hypothetical protein [Rubritepida sp.]